MSFGNRDFGGFCEDFPIIVNKRLPGLRMGFLGSDTF